MDRQGIKLLDFTGMMEYRVGDYYPVPSTNPIVEGDEGEVRGYAKK